jgi:hypothetical protein
MYDRLYSLSDQILHNQSIVPNMDYIKLANNISVAKGFVRIAWEHPVLETS